MNVWLRSFTHQICGRQTKSRSTKLLNIKFFLILPRCREKSLELMQAALSFALRALRIMSLKSKMNETSQSACKLIGRYVHTLERIELLIWYSIFSNTSFRSLVDAEKLGSEEERKQFAQIVAKMFSYDDGERSSQESSEDVDIYSFVRGYNCCFLIFNRFLDWI